MRAMDEEAGGDCILPARARVCACSRANMEHVPAVVEAKGRQTRLEPLTIVRVKQPRRKWAGGVLFGQSRRGAVRHWRRKYESYQQNDPL